MKKLFIVADVHGFYDEMLLALNNKGFDINNQDHIFVSLGDITDRGPKALECLQFVDSLSADRKILIKGNHEDLLETLISYGHFGAHDYHNGADKTIYQVIQKDHDIDNLTNMEAIDLFAHNQLWTSYINSCIDYWENDSNIFVHGWIPTKRKLDPDPENLWLMHEIEEYDPNWRNGAWYDARWTNGMKAWHNGIIVPGKTIWCGHYHTSYGHSNYHNDGVEWLNDVETGWIDPDTGKIEPHANYGSFIDEGIVALDACTVVSNQVNCEVLEVDNI